MRITLLVLMAYMVSACGTTFMVAADDVYGTVPSREEEHQQRLQRQWAEEEANRQNASSSGQYYSDYLPESAATDTFNYDDYYDYEYSSRLRRFHDDDYLSDDYYSDYYTNTYWYDPNPYYYGTSIYLGYDWWYPSYTYYRPGWYLGFSYGPFSFGYGIGGYWGGYYSYWPNYAWGYQNGYWDGYWHGRWDHHYDYCYNPYDKNTYTQSYYGRRTRGSSITNPSVTTASSVDRRGASSVSSGVSTGTLPSQPRRTFAERYELAVSSASASASPSAVGSSSSEKRPATSTARVRTPSVMMESVSARLDSKVSSGAGSTPTVRPVVGNDRRITTRVNPQQAVSSSSSSQAVRPGTGSSSVGLSATPRVNPNATNTAVRRSASSASYRDVQAPASRPSSGYRSSGSAQPKQYNNPVYGRSRSTSSYVSPRYNNSTRTPGRTYTPSRTAVPARTAPASPSRSTYSSPARSTSSSSSVSRSSSSGSSTSRSTPVRRTR